MPTHFCLSVTLLNGAFHGRRDDGVPEWPPSPLRAFQALVAAAAARWREPQFSTYAAPALEWLEGLPPPEVITPVGQTARLPYRLYVPNNAGDLVVKAWAGGNPDASIAGHRTEKDVRPTHVGDAVTGDATVRFAWRLPQAAHANTDEFVMLLSVAARSVTHLGWGIDMAAGHAGTLDEAELSRIVGEHRLDRWKPGTGDTPLRAPVAGTADGSGTFRALATRHESFTRRMAGGQPQDVPPLTAYSVVSYGRPTDTAPRPFVAFELRTPDDERFARFNTPRKARDVAGMLRNAVERVAEAAGWNADKRAALVHGHAPGSGGQARGDSADVRFAYVPLPSVEARGGRGEHVGDIIRVLVTAHPSLAHELRQVEQRLSGCELIDLATSAPCAILKPIPEWDAGVRRYRGPALVWSTVTPVVLPGHEDPTDLRRRAGETRDADMQHRLLLRLERRARTLLRKAIRQAAFSPELADSAELEWREVPFRRGVEPARRYLVQREFTTPRYHVRVRWPQPVPGPLVLGSGRYRGLGVFLAEPDPTGG